jgi:hypothetical protein
MYKILFISLLLFLVRTDGFAQGTWKLSTDKDGIKIYTSEVSNSKVKAVKVECEVDANMTQLVALLMDVNKSAEWIYHTKLCRLIKQVSPSELYYYSEVSLPWPAQNRDFVAHLTVTQNPVTKIVFIDGPAVPGMIPVKKGLVRIANSTGKWILTPVGPDKVKIEYTLHVEPGGSIPAWIVNMFATNGPLEIFKKLKVQVQKPAYRNAALAYIEK